MKTVILWTLTALFLGCSTGAKVPVVCHRNLQDCDLAYDDDRWVDECAAHGNGHCDRAHYEALCDHDLIVCEKNQR